MDYPKRKHVATGRKPPGGKRPGAGRPERSTGVLPHGAVKALGLMRHRLPEGAGPGEEAIAGRSLQRLVDVMEGRVSHLMATPTLKAAALLREELCKPLPQKHEVTGGDGAPLVVEVLTYAKETPHGDGSDGDSTPPEGLGPTQ